MADLTTRDELRESRARALCKEAGAEPDLMEPSYGDDPTDTTIDGEQWHLQWRDWESAAEATMKAEEAAGLASVPLEATGKMIDAYYYANPGKLVRHLEAAIATGNLLKGE